MCVYVCSDVVGVGEGLGCMFLTPLLPTSPSPLVNLKSSMWIRGHSSTTV